MIAPPVALVVEDSPLLRATLSAHLRQLGFEVTALDKGDGAAEVARQLEPQLICLDLMLPGVCGLEVCEELRDAPETADTPILITSARNLPQDKMFAEQAGADEYLTKPIQPATLAECVRGLMLRQRVRSLTMSSEGALVSFDPKPWLRAGSFVLRSLRRRWFVATTVFVLFLGVAVAAAMFLPRTYSGETRILAKKHFTMPALAAPRRTVPPSSEAPAQSAAELILRQDALIRIVREAGLVESWNANAPHLMRAKAALRDRIKGPLSPEEMEDALVGLLRERLRVRVDQNEIITIRVTWWNQDDVLAILDEALAIFLASRRRLDVQAIEETEAILAGTAEQVRQSLEGRLEDFRAARAQAQDGNAARIVATRSTGAEVSALRDELAERQRFRMELERQRDMRISDLQLKIAERSATLGDLHPDQIAAREALGRISLDDGGVAQVRAQEEELERALAALGADASAPGGTLDGSEFAESGASPDEDAAVIYARSLLRIDVDDYQDMVTRLKNVRVELETARAAFAYRYMVTRPAERPNRADSPNILMILVGGFMAGILAGSMMAIALEGRVRLTQLVREQLAC